MIESRTRVRIVIGGVMDYLIGRVMDYLIPFSNSTRSIPDALKNSPSGNGAEGQGRIVFSNLPDPPRNPEPGFSAHFPRKRASGPINSNLSSLRLLIMILKGIEGDPVFPIAP